MKEPKKVPWNIIFWGLLLIGMITFTLVLTARPAPYFE